MYEYLFTHTLYNSLLLNFWVFDGLIGLKNGVLR